MTITVLKDFRNLERYSKLIENKIMDTFWNLIYKPMFKELNIKAENDSDVLIDALKRGDIFYSGTGFKAKKRFPNAVSSELIKLGAKYNRITHIFEIFENLLSDKLKSFVREQIQRAQTKLNVINSFLEYIQLNYDQIIESMIFDNEVITILDSVGNEVKQNVRKINIIEPELTQEQKDQIAQDYTFNMKYYIKNWMPNRISNMRVKVQKAILEGYRPDQVQEMLEKEYRIGKNKAKFLAQNETSIMLAELKKSMYTEMGFTEFIWQTILDGRERPEHHKLNGKIFSFDNPPIIDERTGQRGLPGQTYNCRCNLIPVKRDSIFFDQSTVDELAQAKTYKDIMKYGPNEGK